MCGLHATIECHLTDLRRYARSLINNVHDAEELVQECLVRALSRAALWDQIRDPRAYLLSILHNAYVDGMGLRRRASAQVEIDDALGHLAVPASQPQSLELRDLRRALKALPAEQREAVLLVGIEGLSYQEVADTTGVPMGTVMSRLSRGRDALRRLMEGESHRTLRNKPPARRFHPPRTRLPALPAIQAAAPEGVRRGPPPAARFRSAGAVRPS